MLDLWRLLANAGPKAAAEALTALELSRLHVPTPLDGFILDHVRNGWSVVLTGNAGDGKTHLLEHSKSALRDAGALLIEDATASMRKRVIPARRVITARRATNPTRPGRFTAITIRLEEAL
jgi:hypothetical protein